MNKRDFYEKAAKGLAASTRLYGVNSVVHVEDKDDIWFWQQLLSKYRPGRYKFMPATLNEKGNRTTGCAQCLKYKDFLSSRFFICIDSDLRYLLEEELTAEKGILQTYAYAWENHCAFASKLQAAFDQQVKKEKKFDFCSFLLQYSKTTYKPLLLMLYQERENEGSFKRDKFRQCITLQYEQGDEQDNGFTFLRRMTNQLTAATKTEADSLFDFEREKAYYAPFGLHETNAYLYVRGHCLYNALRSIGTKLCENTGIDFEQNILKATLAFEQYEEITHIKTDIQKLQALH